MISEAQWCAELISFVILEHQIGRMQRLPAGGVPELERHRRRLLMSGSAETPDIRSPESPELVTIEVALTRALVAMRRDGVPSRLVSARQVRRLCKTGHITTATKQGKTWHVDPDEVASLINTERRSR